MIAIGVRWLLEVAILYVVWHHAHWSVALALTLMTANDEAFTVAINKLGKRVDKLTGWKA